MDEIEYQWKNVMDFNNEFIEKILDFEETTHFTYSSNSELKSRDERKSSLKAPLPIFEKYLPYFAFTDSKILGLGYIYYINHKDGTNKERAYVDLIIHPDHLNQGIGKIILKEIIQKCKELNKSLLETWQNKIGSFDKTYVFEWLDKLGFNQMMSHVVNRLDFKDINVNYINKMVHERKSNFNDYQITILTRKTLYNEVISNYSFAEEFADFKTETRKLIPTSNSTQEHSILSAEESIERSKYKMTLNLDGVVAYMMDGSKLIGFSEISYPRTIPISKVSTRYTGVRPEYQRKGIAIYLKYLLLQKIVKKEFDYILTDNPSENIGILKINEKLGFKIINHKLMYEMKLK